MFSSVLFITIVAHTFIIFAGVLTINVIIETQRGIILHHIGTYYEKFDESIFHILIPFNDLCLTSPTLDVCEYVQSKGPNILEIGTMMPYSKSISSVYDKENISFIIREDIQRVFASHRIDKFIKKSKSIVYFMNNKFYLPSYTNKPLTDTSDVSINDNHQQPVYRANNVAPLVLEQIFNNKIGFDFLSNEQIAELLPLADLTRDIKLDVTNIEESKQVFSNMILGQSVYGLKACSTKTNDDTGKAPQCLVVSTIFRKIPIDSSSVYKVYRLTPLPVLFNGNRYIYSNLPTVFGINTIEKKVVLWNNDEISTNCILSTIIHCRAYPMTVLLSSIPCLNELLNTELDVHSSSCDVIKTKDNQIGILNIINNVWYIYGPNELSNCRIHSLLSPSTDKQLSTYPLIVQLPCGRPIQCSSVLLPSTTCIDVKIVVKPNQNRNKREQFASTIPLSKITTRLVAIYKAASKLTFASIKKDMDLERSLIEKLCQDFANLFALVFSMLLSSIILVIFKFYKRKEAKQRDGIQKRLNRLERDSIHV